MKPPVPGWKSIRTKVSVNIPGFSGDHVARIIEVEVPAWQDGTGEIYLTGEAEAQIDAVKARNMGLMSPEKIRELRRCLGLTQRGISQLLQLGEKTWTRWESGRERPSRSLNILLNALMDGRLDVTYLRSRHPDLAKALPHCKSTRDPFSPRAFPTWNARRSTCSNRQPGIPHEGESVTA